jgi:hypothetical protein
LKVRVVWKLWEGAKVIGKASAVTTKLLLSDVIALTVAFTVPVFVTVSVWAAEAAPINWLPKLKEDGPTEILAGAPVPETATPFGELGALLVIAMLPLNEPELAGVKVTLALKLWDGAKVMGRAGIVTAKSGLFTVIELIVAFTVPVLVTVSACAADVAPISWFPKPREEGPTEIFGAAVTPVPERARLLGEFVVLLAIESQALTELAVEGLKATLILKLCAGDRESGRAGVESAKSELSTVMERTFKVAVPLFVTVTVWAALEAPIEIEPKLSE